MQTSVSQCLTVFAADPMGKSRALALWLQGCLQRVSIALDPAFSGRSGLNLGDQFPFAMKHLQRKQLIHQQATHSAKHSAKEQQSSSAEGAHPLDQYPHCWSPGLSDMIDSNCSDEESMTAVTVGQPDDSIVNDGAAGEDLNEGAAGEDGAAVQLCLVVPGCVLVVSLTA